MDASEKKNDEQVIFHGFGYEFVLSKLLFKNLKTTFCGFTKGVQNGLFIRAFYSRFVYQLYMAWVPILAGKSLYLNRVYLRYSVLCLRLYFIYKT